jgi:hypothetical protein
MARHQLGALVVVGVGVGAVLVAPRGETRGETILYVVVPEKSSRSRYLLHEMRRSGGYTLPETQGVWVKTLQNRNGFHAPETAKTRRL